MSSKTKTTATKEEARPALVPKLRFPEFRGAEGWTPVTLKKASTPITERVGERKLMPVSISAGIGFVPQAEKFGRDISGNQYQLYTLVSDGDFVYNKGNSLKFPQGCVYQLQSWGQVAAPHVFICFRLKDGYSNVFFQNCFEQNMHGKQLKKHITSGARSNGLLNISKEEFFGVEIPTPRPAEQQKIAECLSAVDELMAAQARKVDALKTHKKGLMQQLFPRERETQPRLRFPEFQNAGEWVVSELGTLSDVRDGTHDSPAFFPTGRPLVTSKNLRPNGTLDLENVSLISEEDYEQINKRSKVTVGDILFGMIGTIGNPVLIKSEGFAIKNVALIKELGPLLNAFLVQLLQSRYVAAIFAVLNTGNSQKFIALGKIRGLPVPAPSLPEQERIASCLSSLDALITAETQKLEALKTHKKGLMQQLFPSPEEE
ncbi:restriction endonuclease subunit S [Candidatus Symbiobacter mobilis]|uniref:Type I restriction enzyme subunit S n=1 Tax=Candidatus Symbiobacter mobilis CR TaxID=946483 RepID=U5N9E2_9BURK|nr:restriction endonuclease subunit S [Candidatus Symbiobacter mobilis]AGX86819.1 type I restriction enzyme subunit S [Candidatus Symbiobacter mobilis CR]